MNETPESFALLETHRKKISGLASNATLVSIIYMEMYNHACKMERERNFLSERLNNSLAIAGRFELDRGKND